ncbi:unnamed protein product, partial [Echinostoma caproni]|uniref:DUF4201 domain-containing protein n=1 Tax=Echinostoma caproni TaxID=27848 RepID=A0A183ALU9_9TREM
MALHPVTLCLICILTSSARLSSQPINVNGNQQLEYSRGNECVLERRVHELSDNLMNAQLQIRDLERQLAQARHESEHVCDMRREMSVREGNLFSPTEVAIKEHTRRVITECAEQRELCARLETRLAETAARLESTETIKAQARDEIERVERDNVALRDHVRRLECELTSSELNRDGHRADKERFFLYLCKLASKVKIDQGLAVRMDMTELQEAIQIRVGQLTSGEYTLLTDVQANADRVTGLNRTIKRLQDQLSSKEIQLSMWRDKAGKLEAEV